MGKKQRIVIVCLLVLIALTIAVGYLRTTNIPVLEPKGPIAAKELHLMIIATLLMLVVVIPVFLLTFLIVWKYREEKKSKYSPDWDGNRVIEATWWFIPSLLILVLSIITWRGTQQLDPYKPLVSSQPTLNVQVVALDWKWLFIYPQQNIASVNYLQIPRGTPVHFYITADAPMNSFWVPQLSGQIYAMPGMQTQLNLMATSLGTFQGRSANISGRGFAGMQFNVKSSTSSDFSKWVATAKRSPTSLSLAAYHKLAAPSQNNQVAYYASGEHDLFDHIILQYYPPGTTVEAMSHMAGMDMQ